MYCTRTVHYGYMLYTCNVFILHDVYTCTVHYGYMLYNVFILHDVYTCTCTVHVQYIMDICYIMCLSYMMYMYM